MGLDDEAEPADIVLVGRNEKAAFLGAGAPLSTECGEALDEARVLLIFQRAQEQLKEVLEMPDQDANRIIRSLKENGWQISGKLRKTYPRLDDAHLAERVVKAVRSAFVEPDGGPATKRNGTV